MQYPLVPMALESDFAPPDELIDPDPFSIALGLFAIVAAGGSFLETRRSRQYIERQQRDAFRGAWFSSRRSLIHFRQAVDEFETYMLEDDYGQIAFQIGQVRLAVDRGRHQAMRRLHGQTMTTANFMADNIDDLSNFLGPEDQEVVDHALSGLSEMRIPERYGQMIDVAREAIALYQELLDSIDERERFSASEA